MVLFKIKTIASNNLLMTNQWKPDYLLTKSIIMIATLQNISSRFMMSTNHGHTRKLMDKSSTSIALIASNWNLASQFMRRILVPSNSEKLRSLWERLTSKK